MVTFKLIFNILNFFINEYVAISLIYVNDVSDLLGEE